MGGALGIAVLVMLLGETTPTIDRFHRLWLWGAAAALTSGLIGSLIPRPAPAAAPADAAAGP